MDVSDWPVAEDVYPEGARAKTRYVCPPDVPHAFLRRGHAYLFKRSFQRHPDQYWAEVVAYQVGMLMGVPVPAAFVAFDSRTDESAALIEWYLTHPPDPSEAYIPGGDLMQWLIPGYDRKHGGGHNFDTVSVWCKRFHRIYLGGDWIRYWAAVFVFDALIGNTDRHQDNWGIIMTSEGERVVGFHMAPAFDNGTSMGYEIIPPNFGKFDDPAYLLRHISRPSKAVHHMKWSRNDNARTEHGAFLLKFCHRHPQAREWMRECLRIDREELERAVLGLSEFDVPVPLSLGRAAFMLKLLTGRLERLTKLLGTS